MNTTLKDLGSRLVTLSSGSLGVRMPLATTAEPDATLPEITFTASDSSLDRYNEIIEASGWQIANYQKNPVFQADHHYSIQSTIGRATKVWVEGGKLKQTIRFAVGLNPLADLALALYRGGFLNAVSVGFIPRKWENGGDTVGYRRKYIEAELVELSAVAVPANPNALQDALDQGAITEAQIDAAQTISSATHVPPANAPAPGGGDTSAGLLTALQLTLAKMRGGH
jgi:HK97 family phage prohead protease